MGTPMVVFRPTPGQEEKNSLALSVAGAAIRARTFEQVASGVERILTHAALAASMREACRLLARPHAAEDIARRVLALPARAGSEPEAVPPEIPEEPVASGSRPQRAARRAAPRG
jgi:UDP-N-acetylglucosamine:LPS N-acetylglucosamine transferase